MEEGVLGIADGLGFLGRMLGYVFFMFHPTNNPKLTYLKYSLGIVVSLSLVSLIHYLPQIAELLLMMGQLISGFFRSGQLVLMFLVNQYFSSEGRDKTMITLWFSLMGFGDFLGTAFTYGLIQAKIPWHFSLLIYLVFFLLCSICLFLLLD